MDSFSSREPGNNVVYIKCNQRIQDRDGNRVLSSQIENVEDFLNRVYEKKKKNVEKGCRYQVQGKWSLLAQDLD